MISTYKNIYYKNNKQHQTNEGNIWHDNTLQCCMSLLDSKFCSAS